jgi:Uncharacterised protein family (UPF0203)
MGSTQSAVEATERTDAQSVGSREKSMSNNDNHLDPCNQTDQSAAAVIEYHDPNRPNGGMPLVHFVCRKKKKAYEKCVSSWYSKEFMTGAGSLNQEQVCGEKFELYKSCVLKGIRKEIWDKQGLPPPTDGSPLAEVDLDDDDSNPLVK